MSTKLQRFALVALIVFAVYGLFSLVIQITEAKPAFAQAPATATPMMMAAPTTAASPNPAQPTPRKPDDLKDGLFINLTTDDLDRAAMAVMFGTNIRTTTGKPVTIFLNTQGVRLVDVTIAPNVHKSGSTIPQMLQMFMSKGGVALVCPTCMKNVGGMSEKDILPGVVIGTPEYTWAALFADNVRVMTW
jgi:predicted peroxiredoxin